MDVPAADVELAFRTSVWTYAAFASRLSRLAPSSGPVWSVSTSTRREPGPSTIGWGRARLPCGRSTPTWLETSHEWPLGRTWFLPGRFARGRPPGFLTSRFSRRPGLARPHWGGIQTTRLSSPTRSASCCPTRPEPSPARCCMSTAASMPWPPSWVFEAPTTLGPGVPVDRQCRVRRLPSQSPLADGATARSAGRGGAVRRHCVAAPQGVEVADRARSRSGSAVRYGCGSRTLPLPGPR